MACYRIYFENDNEGENTQLGGEEVHPELTQENEINEIETMPFPVNPDTGAALVEIVPSDAQLTWINDRNHTVDTWRNGLTGDIVGIQTNLNIINESLINVGINVEDNTSQLELMRQELDELKLINHWLSLFFFAWLIEWTVKHLRGWRESQRSISNG